MPLLLARHYSARIGPGKSYWESTQITELGLVAADWITLPSFKSTAHWFKPPVLWSGVEDQNMADWPPPKPWNTVEALSDPPTEVRSTKLSSCLAWGSCQMPCPIVIPAQYDAA